MRIKEFFEKMTRDEALCKKLGACKTPEEAYAIARETGLTDDFETFTSVMTAVNKQIKGELSDDELDAVAAGSDDGDWGVVIGVSVGVTGAGTAIAVAAAAA